jgi:hypothetical protein
VTLLATCRNIMLDMRGSVLLTPCTAHTDFAAPHRTTLPDIVHVTLPAAGDVIQLKAAPGSTFSIDELKKAVKEHKPAILFLVQVSTCSCVCSGVSKG